MTLICLYVFTALESEHVLIGFTPGDCLEFKCASSLSRMLREESSIELGLCPADAEQLSLLLRDRGHTDAVAESYECFVKLYDASDLMLVTLCPVVRDHGGETGHGLEGSRASTVPRQDVQPVTSPHRASAVQRLGSDGDDGRWLTCLHRTEAPEHTATMRTQLPVVVFECTKGLLMRTPDVFEGGHAVVDHRQHSLLELTRWCSSGKLDHPMEEYLALVSACYLRSYIETVYALLQDGHHVHHSDVTLVMDACDTHRKEIDVTSLLQAIDALHTAARSPALDLSPAEYTTSVKHRFSAILEQYFILTGNDLSQLVLKKSVHHQYYEAKTGDIAAFGDDQERFAPSAGAGTTR